MQTRMVLRDRRRITYALGVSVGAYDGVAEVSHSGATAGYRTFLARYPDQHVSLVVLCNVGSANPVALGHQVADLLITKPAAAAQSGASTLALTTGQLERWAGTYLDRRTDNTLRLAVREGSLIDEDTPRRAIRAMSPDVFRLADDTELRFQGTAPSRAAVVVRTDGDTTTLVEVSTKPLPAARLAEYVGRYTSDELDVKLDVAVKDAHLILQRRPADEMAMRQVYDDDFATPIGSLRFSRDATGHITGFGVFSGRIRNVRFRRD